MENEQIIIFYACLSCNKTDSKVNLFLEALVLKWPFCKEATDESYDVNVERNSGFAWFWSELCIFGSWRLRLSLPTDRHMIDSNQQ